MILSQKLTTTPVIRLEPMNTYKSVMTQLSDKKLPAYDLLVGSQTKEMTTNKL